MKINIFLGVIFLSFTLLAYSGLFENKTARIGGTQLNGNGCVCHNLIEDTSIKVWVEGPETLAVGETGLYKMFLTGGPAEAGGYNVAGRFGIMGVIDTLSVWDYRAANELTQAFPLLFPTPQDTIYWAFEYTASDFSDVDTIYSTGLSLKYDSIPDTLDRWAFGPKFPLTIVSNVTPVELISFTVEMREGAALLKWATATELNNKGFEIQKKESGDINKETEWETIGFVEGKVTSAEENNYSFPDKNSQSGTIFYRLKQIDYDGSFEYSNTVEVSFMKPGAFRLEQNFPNPFNPATKIKYTIPYAGTSLMKFHHVTLKVYDALGKEIVTLIDEEKSSGNYEVEFDAHNLSSGFYFYKFTAGNLSVTKKMLLLR